MVWNGPAPLDGWIIANQFEVALTNHYDPIIKHFYSNGSDILQNDSIDTRTY